jgi:hypothetical protein
MLVVKCVLLQGESDSSAEMYGKVGVTSAELCAVARRE